MSAIADALGIGDFGTYGGSGGGPHTLACAALLPDRVVGAVPIASVAPFPAEGLDWLAGMGQGNIDEFGAAQESRDALAEFTARERVRAARRGSRGDGRGDSHARVPGRRRRL